MKRPLTRSPRGLAAALCAALLLLITSSLVAVACGGSSTETTATTSSSISTNTTSGGATTTGGGGSTVQVVMLNRSYDPGTVTVKVGDTVTWLNQDPLQHDVIAENGEFKSELFDEGETFTFTFTAAGTYPYFCSIHAGMEGTVIVE
jgi:plastocyanin